jgi:hypothetical protein
VTVPKVEFVEKKISVIEGFAVRFLHLGPGNIRGPDVRGDRTDVPTYPFRRAANGSSTVATWVENRFTTSYPGFAVEVLDGRGNAVHGRTLLSTLRATYR